MPVSFCDDLYFNDLNKSTIEKWCHLKMYTCILEKCNRIGKICFIYEGEFLKTRQTKYTSLGW